VHSSCKLLHCGTGTANMQEARSFVFFFKSCLTRDKYFKYILYPRGTL
jgi:hypothetical protein